MSPADTNNARPDDIAARDRADRLQLFAGLVAGAEANLAAEGLTAEDVLAHLCAGPDGTLVLERVARLALAALLTADRLEDDLINGDQCDVLGLRGTVLEIVAEGLGYPDPEAPSAPLPGNVIPLRRRVR